MKKLILIAICVLFISPLAVAEEVETGNVELKSHKTARILSLMPINSPTLYYLRRPIQGTVYTVLEGAGLAGVVYGTYLLVANSGNDSLADALGSVAGGMYASVGAISWGIPWVHTLVKTGKYLDNCNEKITRESQKISLLPSPNGLMLNYRF